MRATPRLCAAVTIAVTAAIPAGAAPGRVVLGARFPRCVVHWSAFCGYGSARPSYLPSPYSLKYEGDASSEIGHHIRWTRWGERVAIGVGVHWTATPAGGMYPKPLLFQLRAFSIGRCQRHGPLAYRRLQERAVGQPGGQLDSQWSNIPVYCPRLARR
jgi:hypothetical protein